MRTGCHYLSSLSACLSVCLCVRVTFVVLREVYEANFHKPGSMEAAEHGLTRGTCFVECYLAVVAVAGLLWMSWCDLGGADFFLFFFANAHGLLQV